MKFSATPRSPNYNAHEKVQGDFWTNIEAFQFFGVAQKQPSQVFWQ